MELFFHSSEVLSCYAQMKYTDNSENDIVIGIVFTHLFSFEQ